MSDSLHGYMDCHGRRSHRWRRLHRCRKLPNEPNRPTLLSIFRHFRAETTWDSCNSSLQIFAKRSHPLGASIHIPGSTVTVIRKLRNEPIGDPRSEVGQKHLTLRCLREFYQTNPSLGAQFKASRSRFKVLEIGLRRIRYEIACAWSNPSSEACKSQT
jgi:hypothetical protein